MNSSESAAEDALQQATSLNRLVFFDLGRRENPRRVQALGLWLDHITDQHFLPGVIAGKDQRALLCEQTKAGCGAHGSAVDHDFWEVANRQLAKLCGWREIARLGRGQALGYGQQTGAGSSCEYGAAQQAAGDGCGAAVHGVYPGAEAAILRTYDCATKAVGHCL